jgi:hypothetical protein
LKKSLKDWAKQHKTPKKKRLEAEKELEDFHFRSEGYLDQPTKDKELLLHNKLHDACRLEESYWKIKSRNHWLHDGDRIPSFFTNRLR